MGKSAAHIIIFAAARFDEFLKLRYNCIIAAAPLIIHTVAVVNLFSAVKAQNDIAHFFVCKVYNIIVHKHAVCCESEAEVFTLFFFNAPCILNEFFYNITPTSAYKPQMKSCECCTFFDFAEFIQHDIHVMASKSFGKGVML